jgi:tetratricopeptide (TPR) repeat protein
MAEAQEPRDSDAYSDAGMLTKALATLSDVRRRVRFADFDDALLRDAGDLTESLSSLKRHDELAYLKAICTLTEINDVHGAYEAARTLIVPDASVILARRGEWSAPRTQRDRAVFKQRMWVLVHYAHVVLYREHRYSDCLDLLNACSTAVRTLLYSQHQDPCNGTLARISYGLGETYRQLHEYEEAHRCFESAIALSYESLTEKSKKYGQTYPDRWEQERALATHSVALIVAFGLGWMAYTQGQLTQARSFFSSARVLFFSSNDWLHKQYVELLYGCLQRSVAGHDLPTLAQAIQTLQEPYCVFSGRHRSYQARAAYELALAHLYSRQFQDAERYNNEVLQIAEETHDVRWQCNALIVRSRIYRRSRTSLADAAAAAETALEKAEAFNQVSCKIDALIARAEARFDMGEYDAAGADFQSALELGKGNLKTVAICHLHLCRTFLKQNNLRDAEKHFDQWRSVEPTIEHGLIHALAKEVYEALELKQEDFVISRSETNLKIDEHVTRLRKYLATQARRRYDTTEQMAEALGVSRQTLYNWLK